MKFINVFFTLIVTFFLFTPNQAISKKENKCYMPYSANKDHIVTGCDIDGFHMRYDIAKQAGIFMVILPDGYDQLPDSPVFFTADTLSLENKTLKNLFDADLKNILEKKSNIQLITKKLKPKPKKMGNCLGGELILTGSPFPYERYFICKNDSKKYAIQIQIQAKTKDDLLKYFPFFLKWADVPQFVKDFTVVEKSTK